MQSGKARVTCSIYTYYGRCIKVQGLDKRFDVFLNGLKYGDEHVTERFLASSIKKPADFNDGTFPAGASCKAIIERAKSQL